jgi:DNA polymerase III sliding clamp (beta) subunit (PCNA family)
MSMITEIDGKVWKAALDAVYIGAAKKDNGRPVLECIKIEANGSLRMIAADSYRVHIADIPAECETMIEVLANAQALHKIKAGKTVSLAIQGTALTINGQVVPGCEDPYPDYRQCVPTRFAWSFRVDAEELRQSVTFLTPLAKLAISMIVLEEGFISTRSAGDGDAFAMLETMIVTSGPMPTMGFNYRYLSDALRGEVGQVTMSGNEDMQAVLLQGQVAERVIMPMRAER